MVTFRLGVKTFPQELKKKQNSCMNMKGFSSNNINGN